jgi:hypothetical protein
MLNNTGWQGKMRKCSGGGIDSLRHNIFTGKKPREKLH